MPAVIGAIVGLMLSLLSVAGFLGWVTMGADNVINAAVAGQGAVYIDAVQRYVKDNSATIAATATSSAPVTITTAQLQGGGYLPAGWTGGNPWGQVWQAQVLQPSAGNLESVVTTSGGQAITDPKRLIQIASLMGAQGGFIPTANMLGNAAYTPASAFGALGGWTLPMSGFANPGAGHIAALLAFSSVQSSNGYLYRVAVPGQPQLNAMQTDLSMTDTGGAPHNISGANNVTAGGNVTATGNLSAGSGNFTTDAQGKIGTNGVAPGNLPGGWTGGVSTIDVYARGTVGAGSGGSVQAFIGNDGAISGASGKFRVQTSGVVSLSTQGSSGAACSIITGQASLTTDAAGVPLACVNGLWRPVGGKLQKAGFYNNITDGTVIPSPDCASTAIPLIVVSPTNIYIDPTASGSYTASGAGPWVIYIRNGSNSPMPGGSAQVETFCAFS